MNLIARLVVASALILVAACGKKAEAPPAPAQTTAPEPAPKAREAVPKPQEPAAQPAPVPAQTPVPTPAPAPKAEKASAAPASPPPVAPQKAPLGKAEIEKDLAPTIDHARTVTKSEKSAARSRADKAEQEMMELTGKK
jgi:hypothetical protein